MLEILDELEKETKRTVKLLQEIPEHRRLQILLSWMGLNKQKEMNDFLESKSAN